MQPLEMNPRIRDMWAEALESGEYCQGNGRLRFNKKHCCLGVLTDLYVKETGDYDVWNVRDDILSNLVVDWAELTSAIPRVTLPMDLQQGEALENAMVCNVDEEMPLTTLNDEVFRENGFPHIARAIRGNHNNGTQDFNQ